MLNWLFGKKENVAAPQGPAPAGQNHRAAPQPGAREVPPPSPRQPAPVAPEQENLQRWKASGQPRAWVEAHGGMWNHEDWLRLLEELRRSPFWPMQPDAVGLALEEAKNALQHN
jgi:hypothetical protein